MLTKKQASMAAISSYTAISDIGKLRIALNEAVENGMTVNELREVFIQLIAYCGFPRGLRGINICMEILEELKARGIEIPEGRTSSPITDTRSKYERGEEIQMFVSGWSKEELRSGMLGFYPKVEIFLKEYVFADIYDSDVLNYADREIVTVSAQMAMDGIDPMIQSHLNAAINVGLSEADIRQLIDLIEHKFGGEKADRCRELFDNVISIRKIKNTDLK